jgi:cation diffusion facilitator CzcD-associated flavoprotein CzcO
VWDDWAARWTLHTPGGTVSARVLVSGVGGLSEPRVPELPGRFEGPAFHSARWPAGFDSAGKRVAVIGTGASAIQVAPALQEKVRRLTPFQRTPPWVVPRGDRPIPERVQRFFRRYPWLLRAWRGVLYGLRELSGVAFRSPRLARLLEGLARWHLRRQVHDPALRRTLTPSYTLGCKRVLLSDDYYPALTQPNVRVVDGAASALHPGAVFGPRGTAHPADAVVYCTGFHVTDFPFADRVHGRGGHSLRAVWGRSMEAHLGTTVAGFPNLFLLQGPNTDLGHNSVLLMIEAQIEHVLGALGAMKERGAAAVEPRPSAQAAFNETLQEQMRGTVWTSGGCDSWYLDETGRNATLWPGSVGAFWRRVAPFDPAEYRLHRRPARAEVRTNGACAATPRAA